MVDRRVAAFFKVEGTLTRRPALAAAGWIALNSDRMRTRLARLSNVLAAAPLALGGPSGDATLATRVGWMGLRGMSEDRLRVLCDEYWSDILQPNLRSVATELVATSRKRGHTVVLISENLNLIVEPLRAEVGADFLVANRLEMVDGKTTGRLLEPVITGHMAARWAKGFADEHDIDLTASCAYGSSAADSLLLQTAGKPCAVTPDRRLRGIARDLDWPVVEG